MYQLRTYHSWVKSKDLVTFGITIKETDLFISAATDLNKQALELAHAYRKQLEDYIAGHPRFAASLSPVDVKEDSPDIVRDMAGETHKVGVGPMAAVAGAIAGAVGTGLLKYSPQVIVENGGDIFIKSDTDRIIGIYAGDSPFTGRLGLEIKGQGSPLGVCTSSATVGPSFSFGKADAAVVIAGSATLADAAATAVGNLVKQPEDIDSAIKFARSIPGVLGTVIILGDKLGVWGQASLCEL